MFAYRRGDAVKITASGVKAEVLALYENEDGVHEFLCRYVTTGGETRDKWLKVNALAHWTG